MATKRFCDICDTLFTEEDTQPLIRILKYGEQQGSTLIARASVMITNEHDHVLPDICVPCRIKIITEGEKVATLQPTYAPKLIPPPPEVAQLREGPAPVNMFEPSIKTNRPEPNPANPVGASELHDEST